MLRFSSSQRALFTRMLKNNLARSVKGQRMLSLNQVPGPQQALDQFKPTAQDPARSEPSLKNVPLFKMMNY